MTLTQRPEEPERDSNFRAPSHYPRCRRAKCFQQPVADMARPLWRGQQKRSWWAYCAQHLAEYGREVRDGQVWFVGGA